MLELEIQKLGFSPCKWTMKQGNFSQVAAAIDPYDHSVVVCKLFHLESHARKQSEWMMMCNDRRVKSVPSIRRLAKGRLIVYSYAFGETLTELAKRQCSEAEAVSAAIAIVGAVYELARNGIYHGDLHADNLLINSSIASVIDPAQDSKCDDADSVIDAFARVGFISKYAARDCGLRNPARSELQERHFGAVRDVLSGLAPMLRRVTREARRRVEAVEAGERGESSENLTTRRTERQEEGTR